MPRRFATSIALLALALLAACSPAAPSDPAAPTDVTATPGPGFITVGWTDRSDGESTFAIYRESVETQTATPEVPSLQPAQSATPLATVDPGTTEYVDHEIEPGTSYRYGVAAVDGDGRESASTEGPASQAVVEPGVDLVVGTIARPNGTQGTGALLYVFFPQEGVPADDVTIELTGPPGWNGDVPDERSISQFVFDVGWGTFPEYGADAVEGTYQVEVTRADDTFTAEATLDDASFRFPPPDTLTITEASDTRVAVEWDPVPGAVSYIAGLIVSPYDPIVFEATTATSHVFEDLDLPELQEGEEYRVELSAWQVDQRPDIEAPSKPDPYGYSIDWWPLTF